jgi:protein-tyrosine phosphatase
MPSVLFVCQANRCRSPIAAALLNEKVKSDPVTREWRIESAGTWTVAGQPALPDVEVVMLRRGLDLSSHRSRIVTAELLESFQLILTMESGQKEALRVEFPQAARRIYMLSELIGVREDIHDPMGPGHARVGEIVNEIDELLQLGYTRLVRLAGG